MKPVVISTIIALAVALAPFADDAADPVHAGGAPFIVTVNSTADGPDIAPGNGVCQTATIGQCTFRAAVQEVNAFAFPTSVILFSIPGVGPHTIAVGSTLPAITVPVYIDGSSQPGFAGTPVIELDGGGTTGGPGINLAAGSFGSTVHALVANRFVGTGMQTSAGAEFYRVGAGIGFANNDRGNTGNGISLTGGPSWIDQAVLSGNGGSGLLISGSAVATVTNALIGVDYFGATAMQNDIAGIYVSAATTPGTRIGTTACGLGCNVISGNFGRGIEVTGGSTGVNIANNYIGTDVTGALAIPNNIGIGISGGSNGIWAGADAGGENLIAFNTNDGIFMLDGASPGGTSGNMVHGNQFRDNGGLAIDLGFDGVTANDALDADNGPNGLLNFPELLGASHGSTSTYVWTQLHSAPSDTFSIYYYHSDSCDPSGYGEGGATVYFEEVVTTNASGDSPIFSVVIPMALTSGYITAGTVDGNGNASEFSQCEPIASCSDADCDGFGEVAPPSHVGPSNTMTMWDNCVGIYNPDQLNYDGDFIDLPPTKAYNDLTRAMSDGAGDVCDGDDDNDGMLDLEEEMGSFCSFPGPTDPLDEDSDGDRVLDGAECANGTNPNDASSKPANCHTAGDTDADGVLDSRERCFYNTSASSANTDGDALDDGCEIASINADLTVNVIDLQQIAQSVPPSGTVGYIVNFDVNKDGAINVLDLQFVAVRSAPCP